MPISIFCCLLFRFFFFVAAGLGSEICQSWPQKSNVSIAAGCIHKTQPRRQHLKGRDISPIYYPSWPKLFLSFTVRVRLHFQLPKDTVLDPQGHGQDEKRCRCEEVPFHSINTLFIGCACLSEEQRYLYPRQNITDAGWIMTRFVWIRAEALCFIAETRSRILSTSFHFCNFKILFDSLTSPPYFSLKAQYTGLWQPLSPINVPQQWGMKPGVGDTSTAL